MGHQVFIWGPYADDNASKKAIEDDLRNQLIFNPQDEAVIMVGNFADVTTAEQAAKVNHVTRWYKPWFYKHVETFLQKVRIPSVHFFSFVVKW